jgi:hypothetical protein
LKPVRQKDVDDDRTESIPPDAVRTRDKATPKSTPLPVRPVPTPSVKPEIARSETKPVAGSKQEPTTVPLPKLAPVATPAPPTPRQTGTFVLEVCEVTGLLPVANVCKTTHRKRYQLGREPTVYCSADAHRKK